MYSLPEQDKAVNKISYKPFTLKLLRNIQIRAVVDKYYSPLRMRISSELLFVSSKTSTTHSPPSCVESECSPVTIWSLQFRKVCDFIPALTFIAWSMRISQRKLGSQHKNLYPRAMQFVNEFLCVFLHDFLRLSKWKFNAGSDSPRPLWAPTVTMTTSSHSFDNSGNLGGKINVVWRKNGIKGPTIRKVMGGGEGNFRGAGIFFRYQIPCMNFF